MILSDIRKRLADYDDLRETAALCAAILASATIQCRLEGSVMINGAKEDYRFSAPDSLVRTRAQSRLDATRAEMLAIETQFGIT